MAFKGREQPFVNIDQLLASLNNARIQTENNALYQTIQQIILFVQRNQSLVQANINEVSTNISNISIAFGNIPGIIASITIINGILADATFITSDDETTDLPASLQLLAGAGITFDTSIPNKLTINGSLGGGNYIPFSLGIEPLTFVSDGLGQPILVPFFP